VQVVACPRAGHEQHAPFPQQILLVHDLIGVGWRHGGGGGNLAVLDADDRDGLEFEALHAVHGPHPDLVGGGPGAWFVQLLQVQAGVSSAQARHS
jgi:hypothetical protein